MTYQIAYGSDTGSIEDPDQIVLLDLPTECEDMDIYDLEAYIDENFNDLKSQPLVGLKDIVESLTLILSVSDVAPEEQKSILADLFDAVDNNS